LNLERLPRLSNLPLQNWATEARLLHWLTFLWLFIGLVVLFSASHYNGVAEFGDGLYYFKRQLIGVAIGLVGFHLLVHTSLRRILVIASPLFFVLLGLIFAIPILGLSVNGATRWLVLGPFLLQPSELIKPFLVLQSAQIFGQWERLTWKVRGTWLVIFGIVLVGILIQPNLSTTALCGITLWLIALAAGLPYSYLGGAALSGFLAAVLSVSIKEYQRRRIMSFLNPWADPAQDGYQLIQSLLAVGSGGIWGTGYGLSQQKLSYLPIQHTDFIFAIFAEEFGLVGSLMLFLLLTAYGVLALRVAVKTRNPVHRLVAIGAMVLMIGQSLLNVGVATGALPTTGLPFPLFSYGANSVISCLLIAGLLIRVARESNEVKVISLNPQTTLGSEARLASLPLRKATNLSRKDRESSQLAVLPRRRRSRRDRSRRLSPIDRALEVVARLKQQTFRRFR